MATTGEAPSNPPPTAPAEEQEQVDTGVADDYQAEPDLENPTPADPDEGAGMPSDPTGDAYADEVPAQVTRSNTISMAQYQMGAQGCLIALMVVSTVELAQASKVCADMPSCEKEYAYAVSVGAISLILNLGMMAGYRFMQATVDSIIGYYSLFMVLWWGVAVAVLTFDSPFQETGNGYFTTWGGALISVYFAQISVAKFKAILGKAMSTAVAGSAERRTLMLILILSIVEAYACLLYFDEIDSADDISVEVTTDGVTVSQDKMSSQELWGFLCGVICAVLIAIYQLLKICTNCLTGKAFVLKYLSWFLVPWWLFGAGVVTFDSPFTTTGNGYFTAWGAFVASVYLAYLTTVKGMTAETPATDDMR